MILTEEQTKLITNSQAYDCKLIKQRWSYPLLGTQMSPLGNIIIFEAPLEAGNLKLERVMIISAELPNTNSFCGVTFLRLYSAQLGSLLSQIIKKGCYVDGNNIFIEEQQASIAITNTVKDSALFHIMFSTGHSEQLCDLILDETSNEQFKKQAIEMFHSLVKTIFLESRRDNF